MLDVLIFLGALAYWVIAIHFFHTLKDDGRLGQAACVVGGALWPLVALASSVLSLVGLLISNRRMP